MRAVPPLIGRSEELHSPLERRDVRVTAGPGPDRSGESGEVEDPDVDSHGRERPRRRREADPRENAKRRSQGVFRVDRGVLQQPQNPRLAGLDEARRARTARRSHSTRPQESRRRFVRAKHLVATDAVFSLPHTARNRPGQSPAQGRRQDAQGVPREIRRRDARSPRDLPRDPRTDAEVSHRVESSDARRPTTACL